MWEDLGKNWKIWKNIGKILENLGKNIEKEYGKDIGRYGKIWEDMDMSQIICQYFFSK